MWGTPNKNADNFIKQFNVEIQKAYVMFQIKSKSITISQTYQSQIRYKVKLNSLGWFNLFSDVLKVKN